MPLVQSPKQVIVLSFIFLYFFVLYFPSHAVSEIFSLFDTTLILEILKRVELLYHKDSNMFCLLNKVKPCSARLVLGWVTKYEYPVL